MGAFYCEICRQTDFSGKGHIFGKAHQSKLKVVLVKFLEKVKEARRTIRSPQVEQFDATQHELRFWCYCCSVEVQKHVTDGKLTVLHGGLLEHLSTEEHRKNTHAFWWRNKADQKLKEKFIITEGETERFKEEVTKALDQYEVKEDLLLKEQAALIRSQEQHRLEVLQALIEPDPELQPSAELSQHSIEPTVCVSSGIPGYQDSPCGVFEQAGPSHQDPFLQTPWADSEHGLTFIGYQDSSASGNVHTGAIPPWLQDDPEEVGSQKDIGPALQDFLKHKEQEKLKKLPPNRVGANFDHNSHTGANWLPSFGRVWNSGRRWQSRHQYRQEEAKGGQKRRREDRGKASKKHKHLTNGDV